MSEFTNSKEYRLGKLLEVSRLTLKTGNARSFIIENKDFIDKVIPTDFITLFDCLVKEDYTIEELKTCSNKIINIFHIPIENFKRVEPEKDTFLWVLEKNNQLMHDILNEIKPNFKAINKDETSIELKNNLLAQFKKLEVFINHYVIKENVLFPLIEQKWEDYRCLKIMWSFHDDIRRNIKLIIKYLSADEIELDDLNSTVGDLYFQMLTIKFREERILFPYILSTFTENELVQMNNLGIEIGFPYFNPENFSKTEIDTNMSSENLNLGTGNLSLEQIKLIFNHLPVDITYVDENNKVKFFSTPKKRIFPRTTAIIGRDVSNCHPPESVHVVEQIVDSFRNGSKDSAQFWIRMKEEMILIQYFAVRNEKNEFKGVIEVTQEISEIQQIEGEKRLLDW